MSVKYSPQDRIIVSNFRYNPSSSISIFDNSQVGVTKDTAIDGGALVWDAASGQFVTKLLASNGGTYDDSGKQGLTDLTIRYSNTADVPLSLAQGELAYSFLPDSFDSTTGKMAGGETLYIGNANGEPVAIASQRTYDLLNHKDGITVANSALIVGANKEVDQLTIGNIAISGSTLNVLNPFSDLILNPGGNANINASGHRITNVKDPVAPQDAVTKNYVDNAIANFEIAPVTIADVPPAAPDNGDLWYDSDDTFRLYVWDAGADKWVDASPNAGGTSGLVIIANTAPINPEVGQAWYDQDMTGRTFVWDGVQWVDMNPQAVQQDYDPTHVVVADTPPASPKSGDLWYDSRETFRLYVWEEATTSWVDASPNNGEDTHVAIADVPPDAPKDGDLWYDARETFRLYVWQANNDVWIDASPDTNTNGLIIIANTAPSSPTVGQAWYDQDNTGRTFVWDGTQWVDIAPQFTGLDVDAPAFIVDSSAPFAPVVGQAWFDTQAMEGFVWDGVAWVAIKPSDIPHVTVAQTAPIAPKQGDMWYDNDPMSPTTGITFVWDNGANEWLDIRPSEPAQPLVIIATEPPLLPEVGTAWYDSDNTGRTYVWDGVQWVDMNPQAQLPDFGPHVTVSDIPPQSPDDGDLWYDADDTYRLYVWSDSAYTWIDASPNNTDNIRHVSVANAAPSTPNEGDLWYDTANTARTYVWDGSVWLDVAPNVSNTFVVIANDPPTPSFIGQIWYDDETTGRSYVYDGTQWVDMSPQPNPADFAPEYILLSIADLGLSPNGVTVPTVGVYDKFIVEVVGCKMSNTAVSAGWVAEATTSNRTEQVASAQSNGLAQFTYTFTVDNYVNNGNTKPSTYFLNKYAEQILSIAIKPNNTSDYFITGAVKVWGVR